MPSPKFALLSKPEWFGVWYSFIIVSTLALRTWSYYDKRWHFFMFDFAILLEFLVLATPLRAACDALVADKFLLAHGSLMVAILTWRNSLVFHSLDKVTSVTIHFMPPLVSFLARWYPERSGFRMCDNAGLMDYDCPALGINEAVLLRINAYLVWQLGQIFITEPVFGRMLARDKTLKSIRWLCKDNRNGMHQFCKKICRIVGIFGPTETFDPETEEQDALGGTAGLHFGHACAWDYCVSQLLGSTNFSRVLAYSRTFAAYCDFHPDPCSGTAKNHVCRP